MKSEVRRARGLQDPFDDVVDRSVHAALEITHVDDSKIWMTRSKLGGPDFQVGIRAVRIGEDIRDVLGMLDAACSDVFAEHGIKRCLIVGQAIHR